MPSEAAALWSAIPLDTDIVITHTPPHGHCDYGPVGAATAEGCEALLATLWRVRPKLMVCGHRHNGRGVERVRWRPDSPSSTTKSMISEVVPWKDPGAGQGNKKESKVDLSAKGGNALQNTGAWRSATDRNDVSRLDAEHDLRQMEKPAFPDFVRQASLNETDVHTNSIEQGSKTSQRTAQLAAYDSSQRATLMGRMGRKETCIVNASYMATNYGQRKGFNKPIVVDLDLPIRYDKN